MIVVVLFPSLRRMGPYKRASQVLKRNLLQMFLLTKQSSQFTLYVFNLKILNCWYLITRHLQNSKKYFSSWSPKYVLTPSWFRKLPIGHNGRSYFILIILKGEKSIDFIKGYWFVNQRALETHKLFPIFHIVLICIVAFVGQISLIVAKDVFFFFFYVEKV